MVRSLHRNPSTLRLARNPATSKLIAGGSNCQYCTATPPFMKVKIGTIVPITLVGEYLGAGMGYADHAVWAVDPAQAINGRFLKLYYEGLSDWPEPLPHSCTWSREIPCNGYLSVPGGSEHFLNYIRIKLIRQDITITINLQVIDENGNVFEVGSNAGAPDYFQPWEWETSTISPVGACAEYNEVISNGHGSIEIGAATENEDIIPPGWGEGLSWIYEPVRHCVGLPWHGVCGAVVLANGQRPNVEYGWFTTYGNDWLGWFEGRFGYCDLDYDPMDTAKSYIVIARSITYPWITSKKTTTSGGEQGAWEISNPNSNSIGFTWTYCFPELDCWCVQIINMNEAETGHDDDVIEYFFECLDDASKNSGWIPYASPVQYSVCYDGPDDPPLNWRVRARATGPCYEAQNHVRYSDWVDCSGS